MGTVKLRILNWDAYNEKRKDVKKTSWFRMEHGFAQSQSLFGLNATTRYIFFTLLGYAGERQAGELEFNSDWFLHFHGAGAFTENELFTAIEELNGRTIHVTDTGRARAAHVTDTGRTRDEHEPLRDGRDETDETNETETRGPQNSKTPAVHVTPDELDELSSRLPPGSLSSLFFQFDKAFIGKHLRDAIAYCDTKGDSVGGVVQLKTLQRYLKIERDKPPDKGPPNKPKNEITGIAAEIRAMGGVDAARSV